MLEDIKCPITENLIGALICVFSRILTVGALQWWSHSSSLLHLSGAILVCPDGNLRLKGNVYRIVPISEVACPKKDSITASNWGRFLPGLQIKSPLKWFVLGGFVLTPTPHIEPSFTLTLPLFNPLCCPCLSSHPKRNKLLLHRHNILITNQLHSPWNYYRLWYTWIINNNIHE